MNYKNLYNTIEKIVNSKFEPNHLDKTIKELGASLLVEINNDIKIDGVRIYKRLNDVYVLKYQFGKKGFATPGFKISASYSPIKELINNDDGIIIKTHNDHGVNRYLEKKLGVENFCALRIGDRAEYLLGINLPNNLSSENNEQIKYLLRTLSSTINTKLKKEKFESILKEASKLQRRILPRDQPKFDGYDLYFFAKQAEKVGGDNIKFKVIDDKIVLSISDASGHGLIPAIQAMRVHEVLTTSLDFGHYEEIEKILKILNGRIHGTELSDKFVTFFYGLLNKEGNLVYSNAGHNPPLLLNYHKNEFKELNIGGIPLGALTNSEYSKDNVKLEKNDILIMYTDGIIEIFNKKREIFGEQRLKEVILKNKNETSKDLVNIILSEITRHSRKINLEDDMTLAVIKKT